LGRAAHVGVGALDQLSGQLLGIRSQQMACEVPHGILGCGLDDGLERAPELRILLDRAQGQAPRPRAHAAVVVGRGDLDESDEGNRARADRLRQALGEGDRRVAFEERAERGDRLDAGRVGRPRGAVGAGRRQRRRRGLVHHARGQQATEQLDRRGATVAPVGDREVALTEYPPQRLVERDGLQLDADRTLRRDASANVRAGCGFDSPNALGDGNLGRVDREPVVAVLHGGQRRRRDRRRQDEGHERPPSEPGHVERRYSRDSASASQSAYRVVGSGDGIVPAIDGPSIPRPPNP
jgi:hypothetical protein